MPNRKSIRKPGYDYSGPGSYFVTVCAYNRQCIFGDIIDGIMKLNRSGEIVESSWKQLSQHYERIELDAFIVMPNHVHGIITLFDVGAGLRPALTEMKTKSHSLPEIVRAFKSFSSRAINEIQNSHGIETWQRNYYDHIIRSEKALNLIRLYIKTNPLLWNFDPDNPMIDWTETALDQVLMNDYRFDKDDLEFVRNYLNVRRTGREGGS
jgi:putative transposase